MQKKTVGGIRATVHYIGMALPRKREREVEQGKIVERLVPRDQDATMAKILSAMMAQVCRVQTVKAIPRSRFSCKLVSDQQFIFLGSALTQSDNLSILACLCVLDTPAIDARLLTFPSFFLSVI